MTCCYYYRFQFPYKSVDAMANIKIASGCNFLGYYPNLPKLLYIGFKLIPQIPYKIGCLANVFLYKHMYKWYTKSGKLYICRRESAWHLWSI